MPKKKSKKKNRLTAYQKLILKSRRQNRGATRGCSYYDEDFGCAYIWSDGAYVPVPNGFISN